MLISNAEVFFFSFEREKYMLDVLKFKAVVENTPLVSIDLCFICDGQILLGKRNNEPLKGELV